MITLRLFHAADPFREIESRTLAEGELVVGRDALADWFVSDAASELSRRHCVLAVRDGAVLVRDISANGVYLGVERRRIARDVETPLDAADTVHLGQYMIVIDKEGAPAPDNAIREGALDAPFHAPLLQDQSLSSDDFSVPSDWWPDASSTAAPVVNGPLTDATLLDAFCAGAGLDASSFAGQDPLEVMQRVGAIYRQVVLGLGDLMAERTSVRAEFRMDRTTIGAVGNNPFKWAPTQRVAIDLLCGRNDNFLSGPAALKASIEDIKKHLLCLLAGSRAAVDAAFENLNPQKIEEAAQSSLLMSKGETCWRQYQRSHEALATEARTTSESVVNRAFKKGYEQQLRQLDEMGTRS